MTMRNEYETYLNAANVWVNKIRRQEGLEVSELEKAIKFLKAGKKLMEKMGNTKKAELLAAEIRRLEQIERVEKKISGVARFIELNLRKLVHI